MKILISSILCLTLLQCCLVQTRTIENVIEDLNHIFMDMWRQYVSDNMVLTGNGKVKVSNYGRFSLSVYYNSKHQVEQIPKATRNEIQQIVENTDMTWLEELIKHCCVKAEITLRDLLKSADSGFYVCQKLDMINTEDLWDMIRGFHDDIDLTKWDEITKECPNVSTTPEEMQYCLIRTLYFTLAPIVDEGQKMINARLDEMDTVLNGRKIKSKSVTKLLRIKLTNGFRLAFKPLRINNVSTVSCHQIMQLGFVVGGGLLYV